MKKLYAVLESITTWVLEDGTTPDKSSMPTTIYYYLYIDEKGERSMKMKGKHVPKNLTIEKVAEDHTIFLKFVNPWIEGAFVQHVEERRFKQGPAEEEKPSPQVSVSKFSETWIDALYEWYCKAKGRVFLDLTYKDIEEIYNKKADKAE